MKREKGELSTPSSTTNRIFWTPSSSIEQEKTKRENLCCGNALSVAVEGFCVDHFLFNGSLSLSLLLPPIFSHAIKVSIHVEYTRQTKREKVRARAICSTVRSSIHSLLSVLCNSPAVHVRLCTCVYTLFTSSFFPFRSLVYMCVRTHTLALVAERLLRGQFRSRIFFRQPLFILWANVKIKTFISGLDKRAYCCSRSMFLQVNIHIDETKEEQKRRRRNQSISVNTINQFTE